MKAEAKYHVQNIRRVHHLLVANLLNLKINNFVTVNKYRELHPAPCFTVLQQDVRVAGFHNAPILHHKNPEEDQK